MPLRITPPDAQTTIGRFSAAPQVIAAVRDASARTGTSFDTLMASAAIESGLQPTAKARTSTASGLYQFTEQTWLNAVRQFGPAHGLMPDAAAVVQRGGRLTVDDPATRQRILDMRFDPAVASTMAGEHMRGLADRLQTDLGRTPDAGEIYLAHFLGGSGAAQMLQAAAATPTRPAADVLPSAARANTTLFYGSGGAPYGAAEFVQRVRGRVGKAFNDIGSTMPAGGIEFSGRATPARSADAPDAGASGWGVSTPRRVASDAERVMQSTLAEVFTRVDRSVAREQDARNRRDHALPPGITAAIQSATGQAPTGSGSAL